jgi:type I restriction enzyme R subunit
LLETQFHIEVSLGIDNTVKKHIYLNEIKVIEWQKNSDITGAINIELGDIMYELIQKYSLNTNWDDIDQLIEECMKIAVLKYK